MPPIYCGNNLNDPRLLNGTHVVGTNYQCLKRGIGIGSSMPYDAAYNGVHAPIDGRRFYCGNAPIPPVAGGYFAVGSPSKCLQVGIGVGKAQASARGPPIGVNMNLIFLPFILFFAAIFAIIYFTKPKFITKKDNQNIDIINWEKFIAYYLLFCFIVGIIIWFLWKKYITN